MNYSKILELAQGDNDFIVALLQENIKIFDELKNKYSEAMDQADYKAIKFVNHKASSCIQLLDIDELDKAIKKGEELLVSHADDKISIQKNILEVKSLCEGVVGEINNYIKAL